LKLSMTKVPCNVVVLILQERCRNGPEIGECLRVDRKRRQNVDPTFSMEQYTNLCFLSTTKWLRTMFSLLRPTYALSFFWQTCRSVFRLSWKISTNDWRNIYIHVYYLQLRFIIISSSIVVVEIENTNLCIVPWRK
jgi:hypothetical protein